MRVPTYVSVKKVFPSRCGETMMTVKVRERERSTSNSQKSSVKGTMNGGEGGKNSPKTVKRSENAGKLD